MLFRSLALVDALVLAEVLALVEALVLALVDALVPVSYTHLDVYKRQAHACHLVKHHKQILEGNGCHSSVFLRSMCLRDRQSPDCSKY